jgi:hypothetical protein
MGDPERGKFYGYTNNQESDGNAVGSLRGRSNGHRESGIPDAHCAAMEPRLGRVGGIACSC